MASTDQIEFLHSTDLNNLRVDSEISLQEFCNSILDRYRVTRKYAIPILIVAHLQTWKASNMYGWIGGHLLLFNSQFREDLELQTRWFGVIFGCTYNPKSSYIGFILWGSKEDLSDASIDWIQVQTKTV